MGATQLAADSPAPGAGVKGPGAVVNEYLRVRPGPGVRAVVVGYSGYRTAGQAPARHRGLPSPYLTLIFTLDEPLTVAGHPDPRQAPATFDTLAGGLHTSPALIDHDGWQSGVQLAVTPLAARAGRRAPRPPPRGGQGLGTPAGGRRRPTGGRWPTWPSTAATTTRPTWTASSARWRAARRPGGWPKRLD